MQPIAIYDMDKTITRWPTWTPFLCYAAWRLRPWRLALLPVAGLVAVGYTLGAVDRARLKELTQALLIGGAVPHARMSGVAARFAARVVGRGVFAAARAQIDQDRGEGRRLVLATASYHFYAAAIAQRLGIDDVIATESRYRDDGATLVARIAGDNCYGAAKLQRIEAWLGAAGLERAEIHARFYSDHASDAPALAWADEAVAVNPHRPLRAMAQARGWRIVAWA